jgi:DNA replication and repair protein RecF
MLISRLSVCNFRNLDSININPDPNLNLFTGNNGQGKTNFIESIYLLTNGKSFKKTKREEIIAYGRDKAVVEAYIFNNIERKIRVTYEKEKKTIQINDKIEQLKTHAVSPGSILFNGDTLFYFKNFSQYRIKFIDRLCYHTFGKEFLHAYKTYRETLQNAKRGRNNSNNNIWMGLLKKYGSKVNNYRHLFFQQIKEEYEKIRDNLNLREMNINFKWSEKTEINFARKDKKDLSVGELKGVIFALIISLINKKGENNPILLIDDFNSEWDNDTKEKSLEIVSKTNCQSFLMSTEQIKGFSNFYVEKGAITKI